MSDVKNISSDTNVVRIDRLIKKIWITRKARIKAEERLERFDFLTQILINYYTLVVTGLSIWVFYDSTNSQLISVVSIIASVLLFGLSIFVTSRNFKGRAIAFKACYIKLDEIYIEAELMKDTPSRLSYENILDIQKKYNEVLNNVENHSATDFLNVLNENNEINKTQYLHLLWNKFTFKFFVALIVILPLLLSYLVTKA